MSGSGNRKCSCINSRCLKGNCRCFKANVFCSAGNCDCKDCRNFEDNKVEVDSQYQAYLKRNGHAALEGVPPCSCPLSQCLVRNCICFKANRFCSGDCNCKDCQNKERYKDRVDLERERHLKRKNPNVNGCECKLSKCASIRCGCYKNDFRCSSNCLCEGCTNGEELRESDTNTEPGQGSSNVPGKAVQTTGSDSNKRPRNQL